MRGIETRACSEIAVCRGVTPPSHAILESSGRGNDGRIWATVPLTTSPFTGAQLAERAIHCLLAGMLFNFSGSLLAGQHDNQKERPPPSKPTPVTFPSFTAPTPSSDRVPTAWTRGPSPAISEHLLRLKKPSDVNLDTLSVLNVSLQTQCDFEGLLSSLPEDALLYLPPEEWLSTADLPLDPPADSPAKLLCNGRKLPDRREFFNRAKELFFRNEDAFATLSRKAAGTPVPLRLAHFRKFWEGLDNMAYYWDTSLDEYLPPKEPKEGERSAANEDEPQLTDVTNAKAASTSLPLSSSTPPTSQAHAMFDGLDEPRKKVKTDPDSGEALPRSSMQEVVRPPVAIPNRSSSIASSRQLPARTAPPKVPWAFHAADQAQRPADLSKGSYKGFRIGNGAEMPESYRFECVRSFLEPIAWAFGVTLAPHRRPPVLTVDNIRFPVRMNSVAWRTPLDRVKARQGWMEGPLLGVQCRADTAFGAAGAPTDDVLDVVRELGGLLLLAQERARQGKSEKRGGEGKWWATQHRWGGGPGGEVGEAVGVGEVADEQTTPPLDEKLAARARIGGKERRRPNPAELWKVIRQNHPLWDPKVVYEAIGTDPTSDWDEVFMVSSLNHHLSILKLRVHRLYMEHLMEGKIPDDGTGSGGWTVPQLSRTRWYDLFDSADRTEAMRGIWGITAYLMRANDASKTKIG